MLPLPPWNRQNMDFQQRGLNARSEVFVAWFVCLPLNANSQNLHRHPLHFGLNVSVLNDTKFYACILDIFNWPFSIEQQKQQIAEIRNDMLMLILKRTNGCTNIVHTYLLCKLMAIHGRIKYHSFYCYGVPMHNIMNELNGQWTQTHAAQFLGLWTLWLSKYRVYSILWYDIKSINIACQFNCNDLFIMSSNAMAAWRKWKSRGAMRLAWIVYSWKCKL